MWFMLMFCILFDGIAGYGTLASGGVLFSKGFFFSSLCGKEVKNGQNGETKMMEVIDFCCLGSGGSCARERKKRATHAMGILLSQLHISARWA